MSFSFGQPEHERLEIVVTGYERKPVGDYWDDNWLTSQVRVSVGGFRGTADAAILTGELAAFLAQLRTLHETLRGEAELSTLEEQVHLVLTGDGAGNIELVGDVADQPGIGNRLQLSLRFDQSQLAASIRELETVLTEFPVRSAQ